MKFRSSFAVLLVVLLLFTLSVTAIPAAAQSLERGAVRGTVLDSSKSAIAGAKLTISNDGTGLKREYSSDENGAYTFDSLQPGSYTMVVEAPGFATYTVKQITVNIGASLGLDIAMQLKSNVQTIEVTAESVGAVDTTTAGVSQLIDATSLKNLPLEGRDYRDLAQLTPSAQVVPGLRGGIRLGGQQSDYAGLVIDGADTTNNFFGENFGSLETKNLTVPLESVQEFQVVTNGFAPEFGRATGGLLNVVTKSGTNDWHGEAHEYYRGGGLTADDALHNPSNIDRQNQFGGSVGFPIHKDRQFLFLSTDIQREHGPLRTVFCSPTAINFTACEASLLSAGPIIGPPAAGTSEVLPAGCGGSAAIGQHLLPACYGVPNLKAFEGANNQFQNFFTILGHYDYQITPANHFSVRGIGTRNHTNGFTGGQGQTETFDAIGNTENFVNQGITGVFSLTTNINKWVNEARVSINGETRKRHPIQPGVPEIQINGIGNFGQRFYLPSNNDNGKLQIQNNTSYAFARHDVKFGGDVNSFVDRKDIFAGWSAGEYVFNSVCDFDPAFCELGTAPNVNFYFQGVGLNGKNVLPANELKPNYQVGLGLYWQDKWQVTPRLTLTYGLRWDGTWNPQPQTPISGVTALVGQGNGTHAIPMPQHVPNDFVQFGPRVGVAYSLGASRTTVLRAAWGFYYAQSPTIFFPTAGSGNSSTVFCPGAFVQFCAPTSGFPYLFPSSLPYGAAGLCAGLTGCPSPTYVDPAFKNPRVSNLTAGIEHTFAGNWTVSATYVFSHSENLRVGGFSTTIWNRNVVRIGTDAFGRSILAGQVFNGGILNPNYPACTADPENPCGTALTTLDPTQFSNTSLASYGHGNYHSVVIALNKRFAHRYQVFGNYTWSRNFSNASSERDTDTFFGPQDPYNLNLDYGRDGLDITHQFKMGATVDLPLGFNWSTNIIYHSGLAYPAYIATDLNGDGTSNQGFGSNDRPPVQIGSGKPFLLPLYPGRQPYFFNWDMRIAKDFHFGERYGLRLSADLFNITNASNLYSNPDHSAFIDFPVNATTCSYFTNSVSLNCAPLTSLPKVGQPSAASGTNYRTLDQLAPGASAFAAQLGVRFQF
jgi:hypothetical protein